MPTTSRRAAASVLATLALATAGFALVGASAASATSTAAVLNGYEQDLLTRTNAARAGAGTGPVVADPGLTDLARTWAATEVARGVLAHNPDLATQLLTGGAGSWSTASENVARGGASAAVFSTYLTSTPHQQNLVRASTTQVGIGTARAADGTVYDVMVFADAYDNTYGAGRTTPQAIDPSGAVPAAPVTTTAAPTTAAPTTTKTPTTTVAPTTTVPPSTTVAPTTVVPTRTTTAPTTTTVPPTPTTKAPTTTVAPTTTSVPRPLPTAVPVPVAVPTTTPAPTPAPAPHVRLGTVPGLAGKCLDIRGASSADGTAVQLYRCNGSSAQQWSPTTTGTLTALGKCLDIRGGARGNGAVVQLYGCNGTSAQQWVVGAGGTLRNPVSGRCLDVPAANTADSTPLELWDCNGGANQRWTLPA